MTRNELKTKHVPKRRCPHCFWVFTVAVGGWGHTASALCTVHAVPACNASQSCLEYLNWDLGLLCAMNYGLFIIDTKLSAPMETMV